MNTTEKKQSSRTWIVLLAASAIGLSTVAIYVNKDKSAGSYEDTREDMSGLFTNFKQRINDVSRIEMRARGQDFIVARNEQDAWVMPNRYNYVVDTDKVRRILVNTSELEILEKKTNHPDKLDALGLSDIESKDSSAVRVTFFDNKGSVISNFIAGNKRKGGGYALYVRKESEHQSYLVRGEGWSGLNIGPDYWLNASTFRLDKSVIKQVSYLRGDTSLIVSRAHADARKFRVEGLPAGKEEDSGSVNNAAFVIETLSLGGLAKDDGSIVKDPGVAEMKTVYETFVGFKLVIETFGDREGDILARFSAELPEKASDAITQQADRMNTAGKGWLYVLTEEQAALVRTTPASIIKEEKPDNTAKK